jgi:hypothetical protein
MFSRAFSQLDFRKWFDRMHPQTLAIGTWLLYIDAVFSTLGFLDKSNEFGALRIIGPMTGLVGLLSCLCLFGSGFLMANGTSESLPRSAICWPASSFLRIRKIMDSPTLFPIE